MLYVVIFFAGWASCLAFVGLTVLASEAGYRRRTRLAQQRLAARLERHCRRDSQGHVGYGVN